MKSESGTMSATQPFYRRNPLTTGFTVLLIVVYGLTTRMNGFKEPSEDIILWGGFFPPAISVEDWWRFITATLLHGNPTHLLSNTVGLLIFGNLLEPVLGAWRLSALYLLSILGGLGLSYFLLPHGMTFGASTIDYGLIGTYLTLVLVLQAQQDRKAFFTGMRSALTFVLLFVCWNSLEGQTVNLWGHVGGFLAGVLFTFFIRPGLIRSEQSQTESQTHLPTNTNADPD
jgi:rhomboid protease GluP